MKTKAITEFKRYRFSKSSKKDLSLKPKGYIGKPDVPFNPSLIGWAIINQINYKILKNERRLKNSSFPKRRKD